MSKTFLMLGGYGNAGLCLARLLLQETDVCLVLAGRSREKAERAAADLNNACGGDRVSGIRVDVADAESLKRSFRGKDFVIVASSTAGHAREVASAALAAGMDYLDIQYSQKKVPILKSLAEEIEKGGRCFITEAGFHPGLPAALVRYLAPNFDRMEEAVVGSLIKEDWRMPLSNATLCEFVEAIRDSEILAFKNGKWRKGRFGGMSDCRKFDFGPDFGGRHCAPLMFEEMRKAPDMFPDLKETGFYMSGLNWFVDWFAFPLVMMALRLWPEKAVKPMAAFLFWSLRTFSSPPYRAILKAEARGQKNGETKEMEVLLSHRDGYLFTAIPVIACLIQYLDGSIRKPGLWMMGHLVDPVRLMKDMERLGIKVETKENSDIQSGVGRTG
ncbi:MAG: saccharopine dehydrogenase NADP-binding domain-containing protein [Verrucomicrobia bacterium]|nr:saccharopine dehydrogenase NADP-binding domain-containing protein [Verrucomicrobiota bacterium]